MIQIGNSQTLEFLRGIHESALTNSDYINDLQTICNSILQMCSDMLIKKKANLLVMRV